MAAEPRLQNPLEEALLAIADGAPVPWQVLETSQADPDQIEALHLLDDVAQGYRAEAPAPALHREVLLRWGALEAETLIGEGSFGEVYRAFDPWLGRHVALKLFRASGQPGAGLDEARRLARLRHRNVLSVYGCAVHDGRAGLWSELIEGRTLAAIVADDGAFSAEEGLRIGRDLAQALAMVHEAGLVHGDVKADNVMRERSTRIVLMDFGAGGEQRLLAGQRLISGTPRYLPPEVLDGAPLSTQCDVYALGVLLFLLLSGRYPYPETDTEALREAQRRGVPRLIGLRPGLDPALCALIERCIATDPAQRPSSARALDASLAALLPSAAPAAATDRRLPLAALGAACAALLAVAAVLAWPSLFPPAWDSTLKFVRVEPSGNVELAADSTLRVGDRLRLSLRSTRDAYVYVLDEDDAGNATVLFPSAASGARNPLRRGVTLQLPGGGDNSTLAWEVTADSAREEFVVVAALQPLAEMDAELAGWQHAITVNRDTRAVGAIVDAPVPLLRGEHLRRILATLGRDSGHVRIWQYSFAHRS